MSTTTTTTTKTPDLEEMRPAKQLAIGITQLAGAGQQPMLSLLMRDAAGVAHMWGFADMAAVRDFTSALLTGAEDFFHDDEQRATH